MKAISKFLYRPGLIFSLMMISGISLVACGGGNSSSTTTSPTLNLNAAMMSYIANGSSNQGVISGACQGTIKFTYSPTYSGKTLDGRTAAVASFTVTMVVKFPRFITIQLLCCRLLAGAIHKAWFIPISSLLQAQLLLAVQVLYLPILTMLVLLRR
jgi:hypothetical protein